MVTQRGPHILSIDVERWFDGNLHRSRAYWPERRDPRLDDEVAVLIDLLARYNVRATFFVLGHAAADHPHSVQRIAAAGHEVACHAWEHELLRDQTPAEYAAGLRRARALLQDLSSQPVLGHRAPSWSLDRRVPWAVDVLLDAGFSYDSSLFPMHTPLYGEAGALLSPHWLATPAGARLLELPPAVWRRGPLSIPFGGGLYWRLLPLSLIQRLLRGAGHPVVTYLHPWELNPAALDTPPDLPLGQRAALRWGVRGARRRLEQLLATQSFVPFSSAIPPILQAAELPTVCLEGEPHVGRKSATQGAGSATAPQRGAVRRPPHA